MVADPGGAELSLLGGFGILPLLFGRAKSR